MRITAYMARKLWDDRHMVAEQLVELRYAVRQLEERNLEGLVIAEFGTTIHQFLERADELLKQYEADLETD
jgi:hypothetical protein